MKDVLEYTEEELGQLSKEKLQVLLSEAEQKESLYNTRQLVEKTSINSLYGALANVHFPLFNEDMAAAITGNGRYFIQVLANNIQNSLQKIHPQEKPYIVYGDTDSVVGSTIVKTNKGDISIEKLFDNLHGKIETRGVDNYIKHVSSSINAGSVSNDIQYEEKQIKYVMKHRVKKRMFKIKCDGDEVKVTEDHSIMVVRDGELLSVKPCDILKNDKLIKI